MLPVQSEAHSVCGIRQHDLEEDSSSLGLYCTPLSGLLGYKGIPHPGCGLPTVSPTALSLPQIIILVKPEDILP